MNFHDISFYCIESHNQKIHVYIKIVLFFLFEMIQAQSMKHHLALHQRHKTTKKKNNNKGEYSLTLRVNLHPDILPNLSPDKNTYKHRPGGN